MPVSGSIEKAPQFGYADSAPFVSGTASALNAHFLKTFVTNGNHLFTQPQPVLRGMWRKNGPNTFPNINIRDFGTNGFVLNDSWQIAYPQTFVPKQPGVTELDYRIRMIVNEGRIITTQMTTYDSIFQETPDGMGVDTGGVQYVTGTGVEQLITGTVDCRRSYGEKLSLYFRGHVSPEFDTVAAGIGDAEGTVNQALFRMGPPACFTPVRVGGGPGVEIDGTNIPNSGTYVQFRVGTHDIGSPSLVVSSSQNPDNSNKLDLYCVPSPPTHVGRFQYSVYDSPKIQLLSFVVYTAERFE